jgi:predicted Zn finger-like uncharacterized protein
MHDEYRTGRSRATEPVAAPTRCPECGSPDVATTSKVATDASYWRCAACGEVWNAGRRKVDSFSRQSRFGRY